MGFVISLKLCWLTMNRNTGSRVRVAYGRAIIAGASLTQNAALVNVEKAIGSLLATDVISPESILATPDDKLQLHLL